MCYEQGRHARFIHSNPDAVARYAWLGHFKFSVTDAVSIAYTDLVISKPFDGEVFSELAKDEVITSEKAFPVVSPSDKQKRRDVLRRGRRGRLERHQQY